MRGVPEGDRMRGGKLQKSRENAEGCGDSKEGFYKGNR